MSDHVVEIPTDSEEVPKEPTVPNVEASKKTTEEEPLLPPCPPKDLRDNEVGRHALLGGKIQHAIEQHKLGQENVTKRQAAEWQVQLEEKFENAKKAHVKYVNSFVNITEEQEHEHNSWEAAFETDHGNIIQLVQEYSKLKSSSAHGSTSASTTSSKSKISSVVFNAKMAQLQEQIHKSNSEFKSDIHNLNSEFKSEIQQLEARMEKVNTNLLNSMFKRFDEQVNTKLETYYVKSSEESARTLQ